MKKIITILSLILFVQVFAQYDNGPISTGSIAENGTPAPDGYEFSELQSEGEDTNTGIGFSADSNSNYILSDDFRVLEGETWNLESIELFVYATGLADSCPVQSINIFIWDHLAGESIPINTFDFDCEQTNILRVYNSIAEEEAFNTQMMSRVIAKITISGDGISLGGGYYSLRFQSTSPDGYTHWYPSVTVPGQRSVVTEMVGQQSYNNGENWIDMVDIGYNEVPAQQDIPFIINYSTMGTHDVMSLDNRIKLYPNPATDHFSTFLPDNFNKENIKISVKDLTGKVVMNFNQFQEEFDINSLSKGIYVVTVTDGKNINTNKLIKQ